MKNEKAEIISLYQLDEPEKNKIRKKYFSIDPTVCVCGGFAVFLHSDGTVGVNGNADFEEQEEKWNSIVKICSGIDHVIGLKTDGSVVAFGKNDYGQCNVNDWTNVKDVFAGQYFSAAVTDDEKLLIAGRLDGGGIGREEIEDKINDAFGNYDNNNQVRFSETFAMIQGLNTSFESYKKEIKIPDKKEIEKELRHEFSEELKRRDDALEQMKKELKKEILIELRTEIRTSAAAAVKTNSGKSSEKRCMNCMKAFNGGKFCPYCGFDTLHTQNSPLLPMGTKIKNGKYLVGAKISQNHEGVKYAGYSEDLKKKVVIHEFLPLQLCMRNDQNDYVRTIRGMEKKYIELREKFLKYYYTISTVSQSHAIMKIHDVFSESGTSYVVEEFVEGVTLTKHIAQKGKGLDWNTTARLFRPIAVLLGDIHAKKEGHYAVSPDRIIVSPSGELRLIGFAVEDVRHAGGLVDADLVGGCSALEQYDPMANLDETTDIYGFTASVCYALTGVIIEDANTRKERSAISIPAAVFNTLPKTAVDLIKGGLWVSQTSRIRTFKYILSYIL